MTINDVRSTDWQMSVAGFGQIAEASADINQCINIILATQKGSNPVRPDFGVDLLNWIDKEVSVLGPGLVREIIEQVAAYEPRIDLTAINYEAREFNQVVFSLTWAYREGDAYRNTPVAKSENTVYFLLGDENGFVLLTDDNYALSVN